jgi:hypothetical protein
MDILVLLIVQCDAYEDNWTSLQYDKKRLIMGIHRKKQEVDRPSNLAQNSIILRYSSPQLDFFPPDNSAMTKGQDRHSFTNPTSTLVVESRLLLLVLHLIDLLRLIVGFALTFSPRRFLVLLREIARLAAASTKTVLASIAL